MLRNIKLKQIQLKHYGSIVLIHFTLINYFVIQSIISNLSESFNIRNLFSSFCFQFENFFLPSIVVKQVVLINIVSRKNLIAFYDKYPDAKTSIETWVSIAKSANWQKPSDVINDFSKAKTLKNKRIVFKISKNRYRLIAEISYQRQWIFIRFIGTHAEYDKIDANIVEQY